MKNPIARIALLVLFNAAVAFVSGCTSPPPPVSPYLHVSESMTQRLMALAGAEAGKIADANPRLTRQLNVADMQIQRQWIEDARKTLAAARATLQSPEAGKLNDQTRIGGWVSISELSRQIHDMPVAASATEAALRELDKIEDPGKRCEYVMGLANELQYIKGKPAAAGLLARAGPWTKSIDNLARKREALIAFSTALFNLDDFDAGQKMLEQEYDPAWRSDVLAGMARVVPEAKMQTTQDIGQAFPAAAAPAATQPFYGKSLSYDEVFKNQKAAQTAK